ncbi:primosomal protein N' [Roseimicrobium sp. ORNL1]|uniref:replication restart helicase PriA n=1 Tax=Roseimicrobium sp. ORNL1 TaxID=2711231 RepID=UPI0013E13CB9|nr:primosomal protein N' [Roseimicrobium sp. ORNL1]QIF05220.1 primosomal protein N' [Roseimicrobium sp. ORNL1]
MSSSPPQKPLQPGLFDPQDGNAVAERDDGKPHIARVLVEETALELDYVIPDELAHRVHLGSRVHVPLQGRRAIAVVVQLLHDSPHAARLRPIADTISTKAMFPENLLKLAKWLSAYYLCPLRQVLRTMLPEAVRSRPESFLSDSHISLVKMPGADELEKLRKAAPIQVRILEAIQANGGESTLSMLRKELPRATQVIHVLVKKGLVTRSEVRVERDPFQEEEFMPSEPLTLTEEQSAVYAHVLKALEKPADSPPMLLFGVTGSGKTEIYLQAIGRVLEKNKTALVLVPEISLTPQTIERFKSRFSERKQRIAVLHSHLSEGERHDEWFKIHEERADIVIGARSAIFAPLENVGLIIVDEEHEPSYKQDENPRYHARDLAVVRGKLEGCPVILGSATPSLESFENAKNGKYELLRMNKRTDGKSLPLIRIVDMRLEKRRTKDGFSILSEKLRLAVQARLERGEQTILFLNRRGFNTALTCMKCGVTCTCPDCSMAMTFHKSDTKLICHVCGMRKLPPRKCEACGDPSLTFAGFGTERAEETIRKVFPQARLARVDTDTMQRKNQLRDTLRLFRSQKLDILIGTQMIAKGLDFPNVTLVGVLNADLALNLPDYRAAERTFQLLTQVAGRAGRGERQGEVFIQTYTPHSPAIQFSRHTDFDGFAEQELEQRKQWHYPPYLHTVLIGARGKEAAHAEFSLQTLASRLQKEAPADLVMGEPCPSPLAKAHGQFRFQLLLRVEKIRPLVAHLQKVLAGMTFPEGVIVTWDVDAMSLM